MLPRCLILAAILALPACHLSEAIEEAKVPGPDGRTPIEQITEGIPRIIAQPTSPFAWLEVLGTLGILAYTAVTGKRVLSNRAAAKKNSTTEFMSRLKIDPEVIAELVAQGIEALKAAKSADPPPPPEVSPTPEPEAK